MHDRRKRLNLQAFTLIELLVVIGVIAVLSAIAIVGIGRVLDGQKRNQTKLILGNLAGVLVELDKSTGLNRQPGRMWTPGTPATTTEHTAAGIDIWRDGDPTTAGNQGMIAPAGFLGEETDPLRTTSPAVLNTQIVLTLLNASPAAKKMLAGLPADAVMKLPDLPGKGSVDESTPPALPMDAWGNPIVFVPSSGLREVALEADATTTYVITSVKTYKADELPQTPAPVVAPGARPFFASPGPDGNLARGDDNLYSFEN